MYKIFSENWVSDKRSIGKNFLFTNQARSKNIEIIYVQHLENPEAQTSEDWRYLRFLNRKPDEKGLSEEV